jgi:hypothetical protein
VTRNRVSFSRIAITALILTLILAFTTQQLPFTATAQALAELIQINPDVSAEAGSNVNLRFTLRNDSGDERTFNITVDSLPPGGFTTAASAPVRVPDGGEQEFIVQLNIPGDANPGSYSGVRVTATTQAISGLPTFSVIALASFSVSGATVTPTPTITPSPTPSGTPSPSPTSGPICADGFEPNDYPAQANLIDVNTVQLHAMCPTGDEDWLVFGGIGGKTYTIDVIDMAPGLDLSLELFDPNGNSIAFNDDFFEREPSPNPSDLRPRINEFEIPFDGRYTIRVRDTAGRGAVNYLYTIALLGESFGPTPTTIVNLCLDMFEPDGLPEQARQITSNEIQEGRRLCPTGDADWVVFFAAAGKRYVIYTDTRRYRGNIDVNPGTGAQAGADTILWLVDRDGVSILDSNDDIPGGETLDSQIEFIPQVDGFYYAQVKNVGDVGNQFIRYDLSLLLCVPGQVDCGRAGGVSERSTPIAPGSPVAPSATPVQTFVVDPTEPVQPSDTPVPNPLLNQNLPAPPFVVTPTPTIDALSLQTRAFARQPGMETLLRSWVQHPWWQGVIDWYYRSFNDSDA